MAPVQTPLEARTQASFRAMTQALAYPGQLFPLPESPQPLFLLGEVLADQETRCYTPDTDLMRLLRDTGARLAAPAEADYLFFPRVEEANQAQIALARRGELLYPDRAATLVLGVSASGPARRWSGPGIKGEQLVRLGGLPEEFWRLRQQALHYPLGWDVFFVLGNQVLGLPRTTSVEVS